MIDQISVNRRSVARSCVMFGSGVGLWLLVMALSLARFHSAALNTYLDFVFIFLYAGFLVTFTISIAWKVNAQYRGWSLFIHLSIILGVLADIAENVAILHEFDTAGAARMISILSATKWSLLSIVVALIGLLLYQAAERILGTMFGLFAVLMATGLFLSQGLLETAVFLAFALGMGRAFVAWRRIVRSLKACQEIPIHPDLALREEYQQIFGAFEFADLKKFQEWLLAKNAIAQTILAALPPDSKSEPTQETLLKCLASLANSSLSLAERFDPQEQKATEGFAKATVWQKRIYRMKRSLGIQETVGHPHISNVRQENQRFLQSNCSGVRLREFNCSTLHDLKSAALCLSGGGIRSATFNLGILQGLARHSALDRFTYLSTVSGGGFIGGWLSALKRRTAKTGIDGPSSSEVEYLREFSNYLTPQPGVLSADSWTLAAIYVRNLFLTLVVLLPCIAMALMLPRFILWLYTVTPVLPVQYAFLAAPIIKGMKKIQDNPNWWKLVEYRDSRRRFWAKTKLEFPLLFSKMSQRRCTD